MAAGISPVELLGAIAILITSIAGLVKAFMSSADVKKLTARVETLEAENDRLKKRIGELEKENHELREQNSVVNAVNDTLLKLVPQPNTVPVKSARGLQ